MKRAITALMGAAAAILALLLTIAGPTSATELEDGPDGVTLDMPWVQGEGPRQPALCYSPCPITATAPSQAEDGSPFVVQPSGTWQASNALEEGILALGPASATVTTTLATPGYWVLSQRYEAEEAGYFAHSSSFFVLDAADKPAPIGLLSPRKGLRVRSIVRVKSSKDTVRVALLLKRRLGGLATRSARARAA